MSRKSWLFLTLLAVNLLLVFPVQSEGPANPVVKPDITPIPTLSFPATFVFQVQAYELGFSAEQTLDLPVGSQLLDVWATSNRLHILVLENKQPASQAEYRIYLRSAGQELLTLGERPQYIGSVWHEEETWHVFYICHWW